MIYGVKVINGKIVATIYKNIKEVPEDCEAVRPDELQDYTERIYYGK